MRRRRQIKDLKAPKGNRDGLLCGCLSAVMIERLAILMGIICGAVVGFGYKDFDVLSPLDDGNTVQVKTAATGNVRVATTPVDKQNEASAATPAVAAATPATPFTLAPFDCSTQTATSFKKKQINLPFDVPLNLEMALHPDAKGDLAAYGKTEIFGVGAVHDVIKGSSSSIMIDVGSQVGWYSTVATQWGAQAYAFDFDQPSNSLFCKTIELNKDAWQNRMPVIYNTDIRELGSNTLDNFAIAKKWIDGNGAKTETAPKGAVILKVDVDETEPSVIRGAQKLLKSGMVQHILLNGSADIDDTKRGEMGKQLKEAGFKVHRQGMWNGPKNQPDTPDAESILLNLSRNKHFWLVHGSSGY